MGKQTALDGSLVFMNPKRKQALYSSMKDYWNTPKSLYNELDRRFSFDCDPCPSNPTFDGLNIEWGERNFVNPPFSNWQEWVKKGFREAEKGKLVVFLLPARTDTKVFHELIIPHAQEIRFIKGRIKFGPLAKQRAPFPSMIVVFNGIDSQTDLIIEIQKKLGETE